MGHTGMNRQLGLFRHGMVSTVREDGIQIYRVSLVREGKITRVHEWLAARGQAWPQFDRVTVYSDSTNDLPLLELASHPVATNPSPALEALARERGWRILTLFETP